MSSGFVARFFAAVVALSGIGHCFAADTPAPSPSAAFVTAMARLSFVQGEWQVQPWQRTSKSPELVAGSAYPLPFRPILSDRYLRASGNQQGTDFEVTLSFDEHADRYRLSLLDSVTGVLDVYEGRFLDSGELRLENNNGWRFEFQPGQERGWVLQNYFSKDGGQNWLLTGKYIFSRP